MKGVWDMSENRWGYHDGLKPWRSWLKQYHKQRRVDHREFRAKLRARELPHRQVRAEYYATRKKRRISMLLWCVSKGRALAPP